jgi:hypothetical protein
MGNLLKIFAAGFMLALPVQWLTLGPVLAGENPGNPVVVELFTSQGCPSCPRADTFLQELAARDDVLALAMHVDYWDYIGWKDIFADPAYTARQRAYAKTGGRRMIYTPQMIINGEEHVVGNRPRDVVDVIDRHKSRPPYVALVIERDGSTLRITADAAEPLEDALTVQLIRYRPQATVDIKRGENAGRQLSYANIVTELTVLQTWDTNEPLRLEASVSGSLPVVVLLQHEGHGPVAAVALLR